MRTVVIYPGRFHPFHRGHKASYDHLVKQFGENNVYIVSSDKQDADKSPFSFDDKIHMMGKLGIPLGKTALVKNPYQAREITSQIDNPEDTILIFAVSAKDMDPTDPRFTYTKKDGSPSYMQPVPANGKLQPMTKHAYVAITPTVNFKVRGADANSASEIRKLYQKGNQADREQIIADLYGEPYDDIIDIFDRKLTSTSQAVSESQDYIEEKWSKKYKDSINCSNPKGFSQRAHCAGRKKKVNESSGYSLAGSFTPDLTKSKVWLLAELGKIVPEVDTVYILGSWYGNLALYMHLQPTFSYDKIINVEQDQDMLDQSQRMLNHVGAKDVEYMNRDANKLDYRQLGNQGVVINTSLTDMPGTKWFDNIPLGTLVVMQARDHDPGEQFASPTDILDKFPLDQVYYTGSQSLQDPETEYNRFMVIGRK